MSDLAITANTNKQTPQCWQKKPNAESRTGTRKNALVPQDLGAERRVEEGCLGLCLPGPALVQPRLPCASTCRLSRAQMSAGGSLQAPLMLSSPAPGLTSCSLDSALDHIPHSHLRRGLLSRQAGISVQ